MLHFSSFIFQITQILKSHLVTRSTFVSTYAADTLPEKPRLLKPSSYIVNLSPLGSTGSHWVCFFFPPTGLAEYFDTFALDVPYYFRDFIGPSFKQNNNILQNPFTTTCGQHVIFFIWLRCQGMSMEQILNLYSKDHLLLNDVAVNHILNQNFGLQLEIINEQFLNDKISL